MVHVHSHIEKVCAKKPAPQTPFNVIISFRKIRTKIVQINTCILDNDGVLSYFGRDVKLSGFGTYFGEYGMNCDLHPANKSV